MKLLMKLLIARLICRVLGHKRGKRDHRRTDIKMYFCPRCNAEWTRPIKPAKEKA